MVTWIIGSSTHEWYTYSPEIQPILGFDEATSALVRIIERGSHAELLATGGVLAAHPTSSSRKLRPDIREAM